MGRWIGVGYIGVLIIGVLIIWAAHIELLGWLRRLCVTHFAAYLLCAAIHFSFPGLVFCSNARHAASSPWAILFEVSLLVAVVFQVALCITLACEVALYLALLVKEYEWPKIDVWLNV